MAAVAALIAAAGIAVAVAMQGTSGADAPVAEAEPAEYVKTLVDDAIQHYQRDGMEATVDYYNSADSVDGEWYVFIVDQDGFSIAHHNPKIRNRDPSLRVDATGYFYGDNLRAATEEGRWVDYVFLNPDTGRETQKHTWVKRHDDLLFASGWYQK